MRKSLLKHMKFTKRRASTKSTNHTRDVKEVQRKSLGGLIEAVELNDVPLKLILNWDQTRILSKWTMDKKDRKRIPIVGNGDKRQITAVMCSALTGEVLPIQLVYEGKTKRYHPPYDFPADWMISHSSNHWYNKETMIDYVKEPYVNRRRDDLNLDSDHPSVAIFQRSVD